MTERAEIATITGRLEMGKSSLAWHLARQANRAVFIFDPTDAFTIGTPASGARDVIAAAREGGPSPIVYHCDADTDLDFDRFAQAVGVFRNASVLIDEASLICSPHRIHPALAKMIRKVRRVNHSLFITTHRPADLHPLCFSLAHRYCFFQTTNVADLDRIEEMTGIEVRERVRSLPAHHYLAWSVAQENFFVHTDPEAWRARPAIRNQDHRREEEIAHAGSGAA